MSSRKRDIEDVEAAEKKQKVTEPLRPHYGLHNQGATCYLNSVLQVLSMTTEMHDRLDPTSQVADKELRNLFAKLKETTCGTEKITRSLEITNVCQQRDAAECLEMILRKVSPEVSEVFKGELKYTTTCSERHTINEETNPFWTLPLSLKHADDATFNVESGFEKIFKTKSFSGDNMVYCSECEKKTEATIECEWVESPQVLILLLKRFDFDYNTMSHAKSHRCVEVPRELQRKDKTYKLYGTVNHMGSLKGGHYTATILSKEDKTWYECNDAHVTKVEEPFGNNGTFNSSTAYLLVYRASENLRDKAKEVHEIPHLEKGKKGKHQSVNREREAHAEREKCFPSQNQNMPQSTNNRTNAEKWKEQRKTTDRKSSTNIRKNPLLMIFLIVCGCIIFLTVIVILATLKYS